ncbi:MAG: cell division protein SepF [Acidimicrobiales bacterium]|nr:cell division protein SepF [Acidimicrobiales bacterium]
MAAMFRKAMLYLGLGPDSEYDDYAPSYDDPTPAPSPVPAEPESSAVGPVRPMAPIRNEATPIGSTVEGGGIGAVTPASGFGGARSRSTVVRPMPVASTARPRVLAPHSFNQAQELADTFKGNQPVVMNLREADRDVARRLIDFSSGLCYGLGGRIERLDSQVFLVTPPSVEVSDDERERLRDRGYES